MLSHLHPAAAAQQTELPLGHDPITLAGAQAADAVAWQIGFDHAKLGLALPTAHLHPRSPLFQGWQAAHRASKLRRRAEAHPAQAACLRLRLQAWLEGVSFEEHQLTPHYISQLTVGHCPVTRLPLHDEQGHPQQRRIVRLRQDAGYAAGHLAMMSATAAEALSGQSAASLRAKAQLLAATGEPAQGLSPVAWARLAALVSLVTPGDADKAALPVLPPNRLRLLNPVQALQVWITRQLSHAGWAQRLLALHDALPGITTRQAATALSAALAPHAISLPVTAREQQAALEDLWLDARVQRRWLALVEQISPLTAERLVSTLPQPQGVCVQLHAEKAATEAWALAA